MEINQESRKNQEELREIIEKLGITQAQAAELITKESNQQVSTRKMRTWLANSEVSSARSCPNWAITALKKAILEHQTTENTVSGERENK